MIKLIYFFHILSPEFALDNNNNTLFLLHYYITLHYIIITIHYYYYNNNKLFFTQLPQITAKITEVCLDGAAHL